MDRNNRYQPYDRPPPPQRQGGGQQYGGQGNNNNYRRDDYGRGGRRGGGPVRDRGRRGGPSDNNERSFAPKRRVPPPQTPVYVKNEYAKNEYDDSNQAYGYEDFDDNERARHSEQRGPKEKPCRTLFVRNVQYNISEDEVRALFEKYGEIKDVFNLIENRGMIFVTYYDVRAAEDAKMTMQGVFLKERKIDVHYSLPKEEEERARCDRTKNQGTLLFTLKNSNLELDDFELSSYFAQYGEVKAIRVPHFKKTHANHPSHFERNQQRLVEFYDSRACVDAYDATYEKEYKDGKWDVAFFWDHPYKERINANQRREKNFDRDDRPRGNERRRSDPKQLPPPARGYDHYSGAGDRNNSYYNAPQQGDARLYNNQPPVQAPPQTTPQLEQAQKAQQILSMLTHGNTSPYQQNMNAAPAITSPPHVPQQPHLLQQPYAQPATDDQASQVQQLLGLLSQAAAAQRQQAMSVPIIAAPVSAAPAAPIPGMDPATALSQLAAILQQQQPQQQSSPQLPSNNTNNQNQ